MKLLPVLTVALLTLLSFACGDEEEAVPDVTATASATPVPGDTAATPLETPGVQATPITPQGWKTLTNTKYEYSIDIPANWLIDPAALVDETTSDYVDIYNYHPPETGHGGSLPPEFVKIELVVLANGYRLPLDKWVEEYRATADVGTSVLSSTSDTLTNGLQVIKETVSFAEYPESMSRVAFVGFGDFTMLVNGPQADAPYVDTYEQILGSVSRFR